MRALAVGGGGGTGASSLGLGLAVVAAAAAAAGGAGETVVARLLAGGKIHTHCRWLCPPEAAHVVDEWPRTKQNSGERRLTIKRLCWDW